MSKHISKHIIEGCYPLSICCYASYYARQGDEVSGGGTWPGLGWAEWKPILLYRWSLYTGLPVNSLLHSQYSSNKWSCILPHQNINNITFLITFLFLFFPCWEDFSSLKRKSLFRFICIVEYFLIFIFLFTTLIFDSCV